MACQWPQYGTLPLKSTRMVRILTIDKRKEKYTEKETVTGDGIKTKTTHVVYPD